MPGRARKRHTTFLVALSGGGGTSARVYAAQVQNANAALEAVAGIVGAGRPLRIVGSLSTRTAKAIQLKPGEVRPV